MDLAQVRATAEAIALQAGEVLREIRLQPLTETTKANIYDIVTEGDRASEAVIVPALRAAFPEHAIVSEEGGGTMTASEAAAADYVWYIDPVDGTTNFAHGIPHFAVSIALADRERNPLVGVVLDPVSNELFSAARGQGTTLNGYPIRVAKTSALERAVLGSGFPTDKQRALENIPTWQAFVLKARDLRRFGSASLDLCYVASGRFDGFWESGIHEWDVLAGLLCIQEAGGMTTDFAGGTARLYTGEQIVASNGTLHPAMLDVLNSQK